MIRITQTSNFWRIVIICFAINSFYGLTSITYSQWTDTKTDSRKELLESKTDLKNLVQPPTVSPLALEGPVDPEKYFVGPSDILSVNIWISPPLSLSLTVTPEGTLIVPTVGEINITDLSLTEAKKKIIAEVKKKYLTGDPTVTLISPRQITVTVTGAVRKPGKYILSATDRIDQAIAVANKFRKEDVPETKIVSIATGIRKDEPQEFDERNQSKRNIHLTRRNGEKKHIDVLRYYATRDDTWNPTLREGDEIFVPRIDPKKNIFGVYGGVNVQGSFELVEGDSLLGAIGLAYGFTSRAVRDSIIHYRYDVQNDRQIITIYNINRIIQGSQKNIGLISGDRIVVKEKTDIREDFHVFVDGEVKNPGTYPITKNSTRLSTVIEWAGGFTEYASLSAAELVRHAVPLNEQQFERVLSLRGSVMQDDTTDYRIESELRINHEAVSVSFVDLFSKKDTTKDVVLQNGDWIRIPSIQKTVYVFGQVVSPGNVPFIPEEEYKYYVRKAGGFTDNARKGDVMIIKRATRQWLSPNETEIEEGDYIWVPKVPDRPFTYYLNIIGQFASVISVAISIVLLARR